MSKFELVAELPSKGPRGRKPDPLLLEFADFLRENKGQWGKWPIDHKPSTLATRVNRINKGRDPIFYAEEFEATVRNGVLYVRTLA
jgi:hypothetical protein